MRVAFDIDDTITRCPEFFAVISQALMASGHDVYIISYRSGRGAVEHELEGYGIRFRHILLPSDEDLDRFGFYEWKVHACRNLKIDIFFEDMPEVVNGLDASVLAFVPFDPDLGKLDYVETAE
jgi:hypothetical protein